MEKNKSNELKPEELRCECGTEMFDFETTNEVSIDGKVIGQERALSAIDFGLNIKSQGYNLYIYSVTTIDEGIEILTGIEAGKAGKDGRFPKGTINYKVNERLRGYAGLAANYAKAKR